MQSTIQEHWAELDEYPNYAISDHGRVMNTHTDILKKPSRNQWGILMVNFSVNNQQHVRSVAALVAEIFLSNVPRPSHFDTPIHLDGDKAHCAAWNLAWRPLWFARKYHKQFDPWHRDHRFGLRKPVRIVDTGEEFSTTWDAAIKYGLLDMEIMLAIQNNTVVFPLNQRFELIEA